MLSAVRSGSGEAPGVPLGAQGFSDTMLCLHLGVQAGETGTTPSWGPPFPSKPLGLMRPCLLRWEAASDDTPHRPPPSLAPTPILDE